VERRSDVDMHACVCVCVCMCVNRDCMLYAGMLWLEAQQNRRVCVSIAVDASQDLRKKKRRYTSRFVRVILAQGSTLYIQTFQAGGERQVERRSDVDMRV
jgi:hypothetical protein